MKKYVTIGIVLLCTVWLIGEVIMRQERRPLLNKEEGVSQVARANGDYLEIYKEDNWEKLFLKGVNLGTTKPGYYPGEFGVTKKEYLKWFRQIQEMNANVIRVYTLQMPAFYEALAAYNRKAKEPLYLLQGVWIDEELMQEKMDAFDEELMESFKQEVSNIIDVLHGNAEIEAKKGRGYGTYNQDVSPYVVGYILGIEWDPYFVEATNQLHEGKGDFTGEYIYTQKARPTELFFAQMLEHTIAYETRTYQMQKPVAITNWLTTDPFDQANDIDEANRIVTIDTETIKSQDTFKSGLFNSYHIYPYYPDFLNYDPQYITPAKEDVQVNSYRVYLKQLKAHHTGPVIVSEFGVPTSRGITHIDTHRGFNQGLVSEREQGEMNASMLQDIYEEDYAGAIIFSWQDEWFKRTWNTMDLDEADNRAYWHDRLTNEQCFGLLSFEPGKEGEGVFLDGKVNDWDKKDLVGRAEELSLYMRSDAAFVYLRIHKDQLDLSKEELLIPIDITPRSGAYGLEGYEVTFNEGTDFIIKLTGNEEASLLVQDYYDASAYLNEKTEKPEATSQHFNVFSQVVLGESMFPLTGETIPLKKVEVGKLRAGNTNPDSEQYDSLADFIVVGDEIEMRIPWLMLQISNPGKHQVIDDFYQTDEINHITVEEMKVGIYVIEEGKLRSQLPMLPYRWEGWDLPVYHERLKKSYETIKKAFATIS
ncbi:family 2 glycosyl transferase [Cellulosilyticum sp. WCF-2]|uniref:family 2 glycosyl transferase n=1 Tax=Cellulosilyticum sp. WCF-2 TaxID=2497860 RepID=UPI000F8C6387|nr:family 2 glycosyl transferase [Cellulosilyticum sp. WCF-2]QEH69817.1 family 2 glycosyl transferase [Cellulosilyticum sp. WCF-2]